MFFIFFFFFGGQIVTRSLSINLSHLLVIILNINLMLGIVDVVLKNIEIIEGPMCEFLYIGPFCPFGYQPAVKNSTKDKIAD